ncbi:MAG: ERF family protein, partial [Tyzzerella sp.]|nr:ERF family protein [Tyzzerella sp.]
MEEKKIYQAINSIMKEIGAIGKNQKNQQQNFMFRGIDAVMNAISPALIKYKVFVVPEVLEQTREERQTK